MRSMTTDRTNESVDSMYSSMKSPFTASSTTTTTQSEMDFKIKHNAALNVTNDGKVFNLY